MRNATIRHIQLYSKNSERFNLWIPLIFIPIGLLHTIWAWEVIGTQKVLWHFFANVIFLNTIHVAFTYMLFFIIPEFSKLFFAKSKESRIPLGAQWLFVFGLVFAGQWSLSSLSETWSTALKILFFVYAMIHPIYQHLGISLMYNYKMKKSGDLSEHQFKNLISLEKLERFSIKAIFVLSCAQGVVRYTMTSAPETLIRALNFGLLVFGLVFVVHLLKKVWDFDPLHFKNKVIFLSRLLLYPISYLSFFGGIGVNIAHGIEYLFVSRQMYQQSEMKKKPKVVNYLFAGLIFTLVFALALVSARSGLLGIFTSGQSPEGIWYKFSWVTLTSISYLHYYIDGQIYKMSDKTTRNLIQHLLIPKDNNDLQPKVAS